MGKIKILSVIGSAAAFFALLISTAFASGSLTILPSITTSGSEGSVSLTGITPSTYWGVYELFNSSNIGITTADISGVVTSSLTVNWSSIDYFPTGLTPGNYTVIFVDNGGYYGVGGTNSYCGVGNSLATCETDSGGNNTAIITITSGGGGGGSSSTEETSTAIFQLEYATTALVWLVFLILTTFVFLAVLYFFYKRFNR